MELYSQCFGGPALRYEVSLSSRKGDVVMYAGPFECGSWPAVKIFREGLKKMLGPCEKVMAEDVGYAVDQTVLKADNFTRARILAFDKRMQSWGVLTQVFHHCIKKHHIAFRAVLVVEQFRTSNLYENADENEVD
jgi:hypothetical protein